MADTKNLILLHGALGCVSQVDALKVLFEKAYNIYAFNFSGHGGDPPEYAAFTMEAFAGELQSFIARHRLQNCCVLGYSMGGYVALACAGMYPGLIRSVVTLGTKFDWTPETAKLETSRMVPEKMEAKIPDFTDQLKQWHHPADWKQVVAGTAAMMTRLGQAPLDEVAWKQVKIPVLIAVGERDKMAGVEASEKISKRIPGAQFLVLPGSGHPVETISREYFADAVNRFFGE